MLTVQVKLSVDDIIASLNKLDNDEREKLSTALAEFKDDYDLNQAVGEGLDDLENGRVTSHEVVMEEIRARYNY